MATSRGVAEHLMIAAVIPAAPHHGPAAVRGAQAGRARATVRPARVVLVRRTSPRVDRRTAAASGLPGMRQASAAHAPASALRAPSQAVRRQASVAHAPASVARAQRRVARRPTSALRVARTARAPALTAPVPPLAAPVPPLAAHSRRARRMVTLRTVPARPSGPSVRHRDRSAPRPLTGPGDPVRGMPARDPASQTQDSASGSPTPMDRSVVQSRAAHRVHRWVPVPSARPRVAQGASVPAPVVPPTGARLVAVHSTTG